MSCGHRSRCATSPWWKTSHHGRVARAAALSVADNISVIEQSPGLLKIAVLSPDLGQPIELAGRGRFLDVVFAVLPGAAGGASYEIAFEKFDSNLLTGNEIAEVPMDVQAGAFVATDAYRRGDADGDGEVDTADALTALLLASDRLEPAPEQLTAADVDGDGEVTAGDVVAILRLAVGLPINPPAAGTQPAARAPSAHRLALGRVEWNGEDSVTVPIAIDDAGGVSGLELLVGWSGSALAPTQVVAAPGFIAEKRIESGRVRIALSREQSLAGGPLEAAKIVFAVDGEALAAAGRVDLAVGSLRLFGEYGNDLAWARQVSAEDGWVAVAGSQVPVGAPALAVLLMAIAGVLVARGRWRSAGRER